MRLFLVFLLLVVLTDAKHFQCNKTLSCGCGNSNVEISARIINGEEAVPYSWSMIVSIRYNLLGDGNFLQHACGGTILSDSYILTAASCFDGLGGDIEFKNVTIAAGIHRRSQPIQIIRKVDKMLIHPNWTSAWNSDYDLALLHLSEPLDFEINSFISRTCLSAQLYNSDELIDYPAINTTLAVVGWGRTSPSGDDSDVLRQTIVASIDPNNTKCVDAIVDPIRQICAGLDRDSTGPCYGDFGGPIFQWIENHWEQVGIASFPSDGCKNTFIVGYTRIAYYRNWIDENIKNINESTKEMTMTVTHVSTPVTETPSITYQCDKHLVPCGCGRRNVQIFQTNNHEAVPYSWSMIVSIRLNNQHKHSCSGSILSESYILTSASCIVNVSSYGITVLAGIHNHSEVDGLYRKVDRIFFHPDYTGSRDNHANDLAILHISEAWNFERDFFISRICLPNKYEVLPESVYYPAPGAPLAAIGWGSMNCENQTEQQLLQQIRMYAVSDVEKDCYILNKHRNIQFCAEVRNENTVPCVHDPGSPIFEWVDNYWQQVGITSYSIDCVQFKNLGIYTRIIDYTDWIHSIIDSCSPPIPTSTSPSPSTIVTTTRVAAANTTTTKPWKLPELYRCNHTLTCGCGAVPVVLSPARIVGGEKAVDYSWPMIVSLRFPVENNHICGGTVLSNSFVLTAAHCLEGYISNPPADLSISVGMTNLSDPKQIRRVVDHIYFHPNYTGIDNDYRHDIAVLHLSQPLSMKNNLFVTKTCIHPLSPSIPNDQYIKNGTPLTTIGWGSMVFLSLEQVQLLQQVEVYAIDNQDPTCINAMNDSQTQFCAGLIEGGKDSCRGDSGGPIFQWTGHYWEQVGIVSHGYGCAEPGHPGVYTRLSYYYNWINNILKNSSEHLEPQFSSDGTTIKSASTTSTKIVPNTETTFQFQSTIANSLETQSYMNATTNETSSMGKSHACNSHEKIHFLSIVILLFSMML